MSVVYCQEHDLVVDIDTDADHFINEHEAVSEMTNAMKIREKIDNLLCQYATEYGHDYELYDYSSIDEAINEISGGVNPLESAN